MVKVRFAPSPTGYLHIGGARTALFNWLYAKSQQGQFILRIEDTDLERSKKEYEDEILFSMKWLGMDWDELHYQSKRFDLYRAKAAQLVSEGKAYQENGATLLKTTKQEIKIFDLIRGEITFDTTNFISLKEDGTPFFNAQGEPVLKDEVLIKHDGSPAYNFCCVIDDSAMEITHVIRGEDHISNTPKQILMYQALGLKPPKFAHLPLIMGEDGGRLSKRTGAVAVSDYRKMGFLPEAIVNYLMLLGWSPGNNQEIIELLSAVKNFSIKKVNKAAAVFSMEKLTWINGEYIKKKDPKALAELIKPFLDEAGINYKDKAPALLAQVVKLYQKRIPTLKDFIPRAGYVFYDEISIPLELKEKYLTADKKPAFNLLSENIKILSDFNAKTAEETFREIVKDLNIDSAELVHPVRIALTASEVGPGLFETMEMLGKNLTVKRLQQAI